MENQEQQCQVWLPVIGRALALLCLHMVEERDATIAQKAALLETLGLDRKDVARLLGTTYASVSELLRQHRKKGAKKGTKKSGKR